MWELSWEVGLYTNSGLEELQAHSWRNGFEVPLEVKMWRRIKRKGFPSQHRGTCTCVCMLFLISSCYSSSPLPQHILSHRPLQSPISSTFILYFDTRHRAASCPRDTSQGGRREVTESPFPCRAVPEVLALPSSSCLATSCSQPHRHPSATTCFFPPSALTALPFFSWGPLDHPNYFQLETNNNFSVFFF